MERVSFLIRVVTSSHGPAVQLAGMVILEEEQGMFRMQSCMSSGRNENRSAAEGDQEPDAEDGVLGVVHFEGAIEV